MRKLFAVVAAVALLCSSALAQQFDTTQLAGTIGTGGSTYQVVIARDDTRHGCIFQNNGTHNMSVYFGTLTASNTLPVGAGALTVTPGGTINCAIGPGNDGVIKATLNATGTASDPFTYAWQ